MVFEHRHDAPARSRYERGEWRQPAMRTCEKKRCPDFYLGARHRSGDEGAIVRSAPSVVDLKV